MLLLTFYCYIIFVKLAAEYLSLAKFHPVKLLCLLLNVKKDYLLKGTV